MQNTAIRMGLNAGPLPSNIDANHRSARSEKNIKSLKCLVADDERQTLRLVTKMIEALGHRVETAENGADALNRFAAGRHDLVVTDLEMPELDGYALAARIKEYFSDVKIVVMTGKCQAEVVEMMDSGVVDAWLFKPFGLTKLFEVLGDLQSHRKYKPVG